MFTRTHGLLLMAILCCGCGGDGRPDRVPASGKVTYNGAGVEGAVVLFVSTGENPNASGTTDAAGMFKLSTFEAHDGAVPGSYMVSISKTKRTGGKVMSADEEHAAISAGQTVENVPPTIEELLPVRYKAASDSGLSADVGDSGANDFTFELTDG